MRKKIVGSRMERVKLTPRFRIGGLPLVLSPLHPRKSWKGGFLSGMQGVNNGAIG
jgi:hypothetical protein